MANVLLVDDSKFMRMMLSEILTEEGHHIVGEAENALEAVELYKRLQPDLVTLDIVMPEIENTTALSALKTIMHENPQAKVIMVSTMGQEEIIDECLQTGAKHFIEKPFKPSDVAEVVKDILKS